MNTTTEPECPPELLALAGRAVWHALHGTHAALEPVVPGRAGGAFVTLRHRGALAGCIGHVEADRPVWRTVVEAAEGAVLRDPRFPRLGPDAADEVEVELSLLSPSRPTDPASFEPGVDGLCLDTPDSLALLLPQVASEHGLDREGFLDALAEKAQRPRERWDQPGVALRAFRVVTATAPLTRLVDEHGDPR